MMTDEHLQTWLPQQQTIGQAIRALRLQQGLTLEELGDGSDLSISYLSRFERGERGINRDSLLVLLLRGLSLTKPEADALLLLADFAPLLTDDKQRQRYPQRARK